MNFKAKNSLVNLMREALIKLRTAAHSLTAREASN